MAQPFQNLYYQRAVGTAKPCYICRRPTNIVLATLNTTDFLYTCATHLTDSGFATPVTPEPSSVKLSEAEIQKVKEEWDAKQKVKKGKEPEKEKKDGSKDKDAKDKDGTKADQNTEKPTPSSSSTIATTQLTQPSHPRFTLHRQIFAMRLAEHKKRRRVQVAKTKLPSVPLASTWSNIPPPPPLP